MRFAKLALERQVEAQPRKSALQLRGVRRVLGRSGREARFRARIEGWIRHA
jgi:hypothetical protein